MQRGPLCPALPAQALRIENGWEAVSGERPRSQAVRVMVVAVAVRMVRVVRVVSRRCDRGRRGFVMGGVSCIGGGGSSVWWNGDSGLTPSAAQTIEDTHGSDP